MKERPILFSTPMVQAILEGRKTQTRRTINHYGNLIHIDKLLCDWGLSNDPVYVKDNKWEWTLQSAVDDNYTSSFKCPYGQVGNILWVRETWQHTKILNIHPIDENYGYVYKASENGMDFANNIEEWTWKPSIFMPKEACRIRLEITNIRVERLKDISEKDAINEGIEFKLFPQDLNYSPIKGYKIYGSKNSWDENSIVSYRSLWEKINGKDSWDLNPWVWVISFKII